MSDILDVLRVWLDGKPTSDLVVWGRSMFIWGRVGKAVQLVAGGVVLIDLINPAWFRRCGDSLHAWSSWFFRRSRKHHTLRQIIRLREEIGYDFLHNRSFATGPTSAVMWVVLVTSSPARVPKGLHLTLEAYRAYHRQVMDQVRSEHTCIDPESSTCGQLQKYVWRRVDELVKAELPPNERHLVEDAKVAAIGGYGALAGSLAGVVMFVVGFARADLWFAVPGFLLATLSWSWRVRLSLSKLSHRLLGGIERAMGRNLRGSRPLNWVRWLAFFGLIFGTVLDLLAS